MYFDSNSIFEKIEKMRLERGWSIYRLAELSNLSANSIYSWRDRQSLPTLTTIENIANAFEISPIVLLADREELDGLSIEQNDLLDKWDSLTPEQRKSILQMLCSFIRQVD